MLEKFQQPWNMEYFEERQSILESGSKRWVDQMSNDIPSPIYIDVYDVFVEVEDMK